MAHDIPQTVEQQNPTSEGRIEPSMTEGEAYRYDPKYYKMTSFLGLQEGDRYDTDVANKIAFIRDFTGEKSEVDAMIQIKKMIKKLGIPVKGKELVQTLFQYARLKSDEQTIRKELSLLK